MSIVLIVLYRYVLIFFLVQLMSSLSMAALPKSWDEVEGEKIEQLFSLTDGVKLPGITVTSSSAASNKPHMILLHGLGAKNPKHKDHSTDDWIRLAAHISTPYTSSITAFASRGHRGTTGWEESAESDMDQFTWSRLSSDMIQIANQITPRKVVLGGSSMGSATSLFTALYHPDRVAGLILIRPPTAWDERRARRAHLLSSARKCEDMNRHERYHFVLRGTALSDLPAVNDSLYARITCPVLILALENDDSHPLSTAEQLKQMIPNAELVVTESLRAATRDWPEKIAEFMNKVNN